MFEDRDEVRQIFLNVWKKMQQQLPFEPMEALIADIIAIHPEYHSLLSDGDTEAVKRQEFSPDGGVTNPYLHMGMHISLREQASTDSPRGIKKIHQQLAHKTGQHDAEHMMMECLGETLWTAQRQQLPPDEESYLACLRAL